MQICRAAVTHSWWYKPYSCVCVCASRVYRHKYIRQETERDRERQRETESEIIWENYSCLWRRVYIYIHTNKTIPACGEESIFTYTQIQTFRDRQRERDSQREREREKANWSLAVSHVLCQYLSIYLIERVSAKCPAVSDATHKFVAAYALIKRQDFCSFWIYHGSKTFLQTQTLEDDLNKKMWWSPANDIPATPTNFECRSSMLIQLLFAKKKTKSIYHRAMYNVCIKPKKNWYKFVIQIWHGFGSKLVNRLTLLSKLVIGFWSLQLSHLLSSMLEGPVGPVGPGP